MTGQSTLDPEIEIQNTNAIFNNAMLLGDGSKESIRYWRLGSNINLFSVIENASVEFNNSTLSLNSPGDISNDLLSVNKSILTLNRSNLTHNSENDAKIIYADKSATVNINKSTLKSIVPEGKKNFYLNVAQINGVGDSTINIKDSTLSSHNNNQMVYLSDSTLNLSSSNISNSGTTDNGSMLYATNSKVSITDGTQLNLTEGDTFISAGNSEVVIDNAIFKHNKQIASDSTFVRSSVNLNNSNMTIKDSSIISNKGDGLFSVTNSHLTVLNSTLNVNDRPNSYIFGEGDGKSTITIQDSNLTADRGIISFDGRFNSGLDINIDNSTLNTTVLREEGFWNNAEQNTLTARNSILNGSIDDHKMSVNLENSTLTFTPTFTTKIKDLSGNSSNINIEKTQYFYDFIINGDLSGNLHFGLNTDLASERGNSVIVKGKSEGKHTITVKDSGNEPEAEGGKVILVKTTDGVAEFSLKDKDFVDAGAYRYHLNKEGTNWVLSNKVTPKDEPVIIEPTQPVEPPVEPTTPATPAVPPTEIAEPATPAVPPTEIAEPATPAVPPAELAKPVAPTVPSIEPTNPKLSQTETVQAVISPMPETPDLPTPQSVPSTPVLAKLSETSNALVSLRQAQGLLLTQNLQGIHQRLGELKTEKASNIWVKNQNGRTEAKSQNVAVDSRSSGFEMDSHILQIGADRAVSEQFRLGGFVGTSRANVDFNGEYGKGKLRSQVVGFYATFANDDGWYLDNVAKYERLSAQNAAEKRKYNGFSFSTELGKRIELSNDWSVTPQAQIAYHTLNGKKDESRLTLLTARAGVHVAKGFSLNNGWHLQPYIDANAIVEKNNDATVRVNQYRFNVAENRGRFQTTLGLTAGNGSHRLGVEISQTHGKQVKQPLNLLANYRYQW